jgi:hypothetical protein
MATFKGEDFKFPDEKTTASEEKNSDVEYEIEVVDDTPEEDRGRTAAEPPAEVTDEELNKYSDKRLKERLAHLGKGYHDERRAKEAAFREKEEALRLAQSVVEENKKLKGSLSDNQQILLEQAKKTVEAEVERAKKSYKDAYQSGDPDALVEAQEALTTAKINLDKVKNFKPPLQEPEKEVQTTTSAQEQAVDPKAQRWYENNASWYGKDREMTGYALALHEKLVLEDGLDPRSDEYYNRLDRRIRQVFSDKFSSEEPAEARTSQRKKENVVAPATRSTAPKKIVLNATQVQLAKRLGVPLELYARKVAEEMRK